ncbi:SPOR domain-containing protein [Polynucleobacter sp. AP-Kaivos-20-H2]|uniref:SPOR domain-containing protein n=1 Tax=Polynucleobacter sp. AP-Kaivos-20-H2 TaxID=2689104 RepID=UPI001C0CBFD4|nr:SPOR domain-containing protein [Polynucleobacter sp. AP-Kaivos-20-H2]MBU3603010.1 SPOR domain-containing protein [Polynucleobacter sp. AP-Kaivos-20-H2]
MIRLPSFFKRKTQFDDLEIGSRGSRTAKRAAPRSFQRAAEAEELALTEDPEQQRARHRLIGSAVLVLIAVIGLPRILDNKPKASYNDIAVNIVTSLPIPGTEPKAEEKPKAEFPVEPAKEAPKVAAAPAPEVKPEAKVETKADTKPAAPAANKSGTLGLAAGEEVVAASTPKADAKPKAEDAPKSAASNDSGKYFIQIGAFASEERAKGWIAKLKDQKIPNYVLNKTGSDGIKLYLLRAGPYTDKDAAEAAEKKIKAMGLTPRLVESGKQ